MKRFSTRRVASLSPIVFALVTLLGFAEGAEAQTDTTFQEWVASLNRVDLSGSERGPSLWMDLHGRRGNGGTILLARPGVAYRFAPWGAVWVGYAYIGNLREGGADDHEHRAWEQLTLSHRFDGGVLLQSRTRLEQRFNARGGGSAHRIREFVKASWGIPNSVVTLAIWDELFVGLDGASWGPNAGYDQNRVFVGPGFLIGEEARVEIGYLNVHLDRSPNQIIHALAVNLFWTRRAE